MSRNSKMLTPHYLELLSDEQLDKKYRVCLEELVNSIIEKNPENIETILLYGGVVRDSKAFEGWSDIDIVIIFKNITKRSAMDLANIIQRLETQYSICIDLTQMSLGELTDEKLARCCLNSEIINALSMRENVSIVVFGHVPSVGFSVEQEKQAARFYIVNTLNLFRRYIVEALYRGNVEDHLQTDLRRIIRWTFSIIRASLRLFDIYTHPYEYSLAHVKRVFPDLDTSLLEQLIEIRRNFRTTVKDTSRMIEMIQNMEVFIEEYVPLCLRRYIDETGRDK